MNQVHAMEASMRRTYLDMGLKLRGMLEKAGATVHMTRRDDRYVSLFIVQLLPTRLC